MNQSKNNHSFVVSEGICSPQTYDEQYNKKFWKVVGVIILVVVVVIASVVICASTDVCKFKKEEDVAEKEAQQFLNKDVNRELNQGYGEDLVYHDKVDGIEVWKSVKADSEGYINYYKRVGNSFEYITNTKVVPKGIIINE